MSARPRSDVAASRVDPDGVEDTEDKTVSLEEPAVESDEVAPPEAPEPEVDDADEADAIALGPAEAEPEADTTSLEAPVATDAEPLDEVPVDEVVVDEIPVDEVPEDDVVEDEALVTPELADEPPPADVPEVPDEAITPEPEVPAAPMRERTRPAPAKASAATTMWITDRNGHRMRWDAIQIGFVDQPRLAVEDADALVGHLVEELTTAVTDARRAIAGVWQDDGDSSTEDLRLAFQQYRELFARLLDTR